MVSVAVVPADIAVLTICADAVFVLAVAAVVAFVSLVGVAGAVSERQGTTNIVQFSRSTGAIYCAFADLKIAEIKQIECQHLIKLMANHAIISCISCSLE